MAGINVFQPGYNAAGTGSKQKNPGAVPVAPKATPAPVAQVQTYADSGSGGGGGGGAAAVAAPVAARPSLTDYINGNYLYQNQQKQNQLALSDFDAQTALGQQQTQAEQAQKEQALQQSLADLGNTNAESEAGRGLLNSGFTIQNQDKINQQGAVQDNSIQGLLSAFIQQRQAARAAQAQQGNSALDTVMQQLTQNYNTGTGV